MARASAELIVMSALLPPLPESVGDPPTAERAAPIVIVSVPVVFASPLVIVIDPALPPLETPTDPLPPDEMIAAVTLIKPSSVMMLIELPAPPLPDVPALAPPRAVNAPLILISSPPLFPSSPALIAIDPAVPPVVLKSFDPPDVVIPPPTVMPPSKVSIVT